MIPKFCNLSLICLTPEILKGGLFQKTEGLYTMLVLATQLGSKIVFQSPQRDSN